MSKDNNKKTRRPKKYRYTSKEVAAVLDCSDSYVKQVRAGIVELNSTLAQRILAVDKGLDTAANKVLSDLNQTING